MRNKFFLIFLMLIGFLNIKILATEDFPNAIDLQIYNSHNRHIKGISKGYKQIASPNSDRLTIGDGHKEIGEFSLDAPKNKIGFSIFRNSYCDQSCSITLYDSRNRDKYIEITFNESLFIHGKDIYQHISIGGPLAKREFISLPSDIRFNFNHKNNIVMTIYLNEWAI